MTQSWKIATFRPIKIHVAYFDLPSFLLFMITLSSVSSSNNSKLAMVNNNPILRRTTEVPLQFASPENLTDWLKHRLPSDAFSSWGIKPGTKNIHNLWLEINHGETSLLDSIPPLRTLNVASVRIRRNGKILIESHQELSDGTLRQRQRPLSEKMKPGESVPEAVIRAIKEELRSIVKDDGEVSIVRDSYLMKMEERESLSYPGLPARYVLHSVDACVEGLPDGEFCTEEDEYGACGKRDAEVEKAVSVKKHFWKWVDAENSETVDSNPFQIQ